MTTPTPAQIAKAQRFVRDGLVRKGESTSRSKGFGEPYKVTTRYTVLPLPSTKMANEVLVHEYHDADDRLRSIEYECACQRSEGVVATSPGACSHTYAVHLHRTGAAK